jgi:4-aminobutyrate aminotransferase-like enzyme
VSGTEAAESAVHTALCYTGRRYVITFASAFHGESLGGKLLSAYDSERNFYLEGWTGGVIKAPYPYSDNVPAEMSEAQYVDFCLWYLDNHIPDAMVPRDNIAAIMIEPGLAEGGNWIPPVNFLKGIREICDRNGWLMIADEVLTGLGRTGRMWAVEHYEVVPDILVVGKNLSGGIAPCAGIAARDDVLGNNPRSSSSSTFAGTPAGCAAGLKTLELYARDGVVENAARLGELAKEFMSGWEERYAIVRQVRGNGLLMGLSFQAPSDGPQAGMANRWWAREVRSQLLERGVWAISDREENIRMYPALNMADDVLLEGLSQLEASIRHVEEHGLAVGDAPDVPTGM